MLPLFYLDEKFNFNVFCFFSNYNFFDKQYNNKLRKIEIISKKKK